MPMGPGDIGPSPYLPAEREGILVRILDRTGCPVKVQNRVFTDIIQAALGLAVCQLLPR
jgi:hypothetical protein